MARGPTDPTRDLARILKQKHKPAKARWRVMVASDPSRPVRTFTLPRLLPTMMSLFAIALVAATVILAFGSWKLSGSLGALQHRVRAMVQAADSVALAPGGNYVGGGLEGGAPLMASTTNPVATLSDSTIIGFANSSRQSGARSCAAHQCTAPTRNGSFTQLAG